MIAAIVLGARGVTGVRMITSPAGTSTAAEYLVWMLQNYAEGRGCPVRDAAVLFPGHGNMHRCYIFSMCIGPERLH
jgi:hypothetical protein